LLLFFLRKEAEGLTRTSMFRVAAVRCRVYQHSSASA
jgi:hypothetical protein